MIIPEFGVKVKKFFLLEGISFPFRILRRPVAYIEQRKGCDSNMANIFLSGAAEKFPNYVRAVELVGGTLTECEEEADGLLLPGGADLAPEYSGLPDDAPCRGVDRERDRRDLGVCKRFLEAGKPILGICRGCQVLNVALGGTLLADIPGHTGLPEGGDRVHETRTAGILTAIYGPECAVNSSHHQAVDRLAPDCDILQLSLDGIIEAFGHRTLPVLGVQWHPERLCGAFARADAVDGSRMLAWLVQRCGGAR